MIPETRYSKSVDGVHIAYQVLGDGDLDLVVSPGFVSHLEHSWEEPQMARFLRRLASFSRLIVFDKRGTGMSDRSPDGEAPLLEDRANDVRFQQRGKHQLKGVPGEWELFAVDRG